MTDKLDQKQGKILNIGIDSTTATRVLTFVRDSLKRGHKFYIVTPNPEIVLESSKDLELTRILNNADISIPDGVGLCIANEFLHKPIVPKSVSWFIYPIQWFASSVNRGKGALNPMTIIKGRQLFLDLIKLANKKGLRVYLFGGVDGATIKAKENLEKSFKSIRIETGEPGMYGKNGEPISESDIAKEIDIVKHINNFKPHLLFVALNTPKQEKFIDRLMPKLNIGGAMTVGGTINYVAGLSKVPPRFIGESGFEWLWRLITEPWRVKRILNALFVFPSRVISSKPTK